MNQDNPQTPSSDVPVSNVVSPDTPSDTPPSGSTPQSVQQSTQQRSPVKPYAERRDRFRRSRASQIRRDRAARADAKLSKLVFGSASACVAFALILTLIYLKGLRINQELRDGAKIDPAYGLLSQEWVLGMSRLEVGGVAVIILVGGIVLLRGRRKRDQ